LVVFGILVAVAVSIVAWLFQNSEQISDVKIIATFIVAICVVVAIVVVNKKILSKIDELEDL